MARPTGAAFIFSALLAPWFLPRLAAASPRQAVDPAAQELEQPPPPPAAQSQTGQDANAEPPPSAGSAAKDAQALREIEANYLRAEMENNPSLARSILADDYVGIKGDGGTADKLEVLQNLARNENSREPYNIVASDMRTRVFGDTACITYTKIYTLPSGHATYRENLLHIFTKRSGTWYLQVSSPIPASRSQPVPIR